MIFIFHFKNKKMIQIYTDGSCRDRKGGYAYVILIDDYEISWSGFVNDTTNNRMELTAVIEALKYLDNNDSAIIYSDSQWVINCAQKNWKRNKNLDLWIQYDNESKSKIIQFVWVKGHSGNKYNDMCDKLAFQEINNNYMKV
jgi:ribonuclease HI